MTEALSLAKLQKELDRIDKEIASISTDVYEADAIDADVSEIVALADQVRRIIKTRGEGRTDERSRLRNRGHGRVARLHPRRAGRRGRQPRSHRRVVVNPAGLTRAEEEKGHATAKPTTGRSRPPEGALACQVVVAPDGHACGVAAEAMIVWPRDPEAPKTPACLECAARMREIARSFGTDVLVEPLR